MKATNKNQPPRRRPNYNALVNTSYQPTDGKKKQANSEPVRPTRKDDEPKKRRFGWKKRLLLLFILLLTPFIIIAIWDLKNFSNATQKLFGNSNVLGLLAAKPLDDTDGRTNILLVGYSIDDPAHGGATLTDSIMVLSMDKDQKSGYMLSVPRDLYVDIPGEDRAKINEAFQDGERSGFSEEGYSPGGMGLLEKTIAESLDIEIHNYAIINYTAVREIVDALGGITVDIQSPDPRGVYDPNFQPVEGGPLELANGPQKIDGQTALRLTRARGATYGSYGFPQSDFNRTQNQQLVLAAIKNELNWQLVLDPRKNGKIFNAVGNNIQTDLKISQVLPLYRLFSSIPESELESVTLAKINDEVLLRGYTTPRGQSALVPVAGITNFEDIQAAIKEL